MAAATLSVGVLLAILEAAPEIRVPFRVDSHHSSKLGGKSQGGRRDRNQPYRESPQRECITLDRTPARRAELCFVVARQAQDLSQRRQGETGSSRTRLMAKKTGRIYVGIGGWTFAPWRGVFYPKGLPHAKELGYAAEHLTSIEINGTFYRKSRGIFI